jgi:antitoxin (DNA-binding transcriptional repressor) of toxin-antitoxin stability system
MQTIRVPKAKFKYNMAPFIKQAKAGAKVVVTNDGEDEFIILPCQPHGAPQGISLPMDPKAYEGIDLDEPAFASWS